MAEQRYTLENPPVREATVDKVEEQVDAVFSPARPDYALDFSHEEPLRETRAVMDEQVRADSEYAVVVPPEGRGTHPTLGVDAPTPEALLDSGDATEATGVEDGKVVTSSEAAQRDES